MSIQVHEAQRFPRFNPKRSSGRHIIIKISKKKKRILKASREKKKKIHYIQGHPDIAMNKLFSRHLSGQDRVEWYIKSAKRKNCEPTVFYLAKLDFRNERYRLFQTNKT